MTAGGRRRGLLDWLARKPAGAPASGTRVNSRYALERWLGGGGMAEVFLARAEGAEGFTRWVALKRVLPSFSADEELARLFVSEARVSSRLQHPNLVSILDFDRDDQGQLFLIMELVDGVNLDRLLDTGALGIPLIIYLAIEILSGLRYAHDLPVRTRDGVRGIVHRDISPHNVLLSWEGAVKVSDFGIAKSRAATQVMATLIVRGKPAYMSPEQANGQPLDGRSDLFAVGVMLWEMLCRRPLFSGATAQATIGQMLFAPIAPPSEVCPEVPEALSRWVLRLLARDRAQRTPNAAAAIAELLACVDPPGNGRELLVQTLAERYADRAAHREPSAVPAAPAPGDVRRPSPSHPATGGPSTFTALPGVVFRPIAPPVPRRRHRRRAWMALAGFAVAAGLVGGGLAHSGGRRSSASRAGGVDEPRTPARGSAEVLRGSRPRSTAASAPDTGPGGAGNAAGPLLDVSVTTPSAAHVPDPRPRPRRTETRAANQPGGGIHEIQLGE
jgi:serine/threonine protein kinase